MLISDWSSDLCSSDLLGVGLQGLGVAEVAYQNAVQYAQDRRQGRALTGPAEPTEKADPLFVHPDVRRMLMDAKATIEGLRALRSEEHTSELQSLMRISYAVFCLKKKITKTITKYCK